LKSILGLTDLEKSSILKRLQFEIPSDFGVITRPFVIDEVGMTGRSGQTARIEIIALNFLKWRNDFTLTIQENEEFERPFHD